MSKVRIGIIILMAFVMVMVLTTDAMADVSIQAGTGTITLNSSIIGFAGQEWWVIGYNDGATGSGVYSSTSNSATLFFIHPSGNTPFGTSMFHPTSSNYLDSTLQSLMDSKAADTNLFPTKENNLINPRTLTADDDVTNKITGGDVANQKLWPISYDEWNTINNNAVRSYRDTTKLV